MDDPADRLYGLPFDEFTPARDAAARELRRAGDREAATALAKLPKPSPAAWAANQVSRARPELLAALLEAGDALRRAQEDALAGRGGGALRDATAAERRAVDAFLAAATEERPGGRALSRALTDRLRSTLHAVAGDEELRAALAAGRLVGEAEAAGAWPGAVFAGLAPAEPAAPEPEAPEPPPKRPRQRTSKRGAADRKTAKRDGAQRESATEREAAEREAAEREAAEREAAEREAAQREARHALERDLRAARAALRVRERTHAAAQEEAAAAQDRLEAALQAAEDARADAEAAADAEAEARDALSHARDTVARLAERLD